MKRICNNVLPALLLFAAAGCAHSRKAAFVGSEGITAQVAAGSIEDMHQQMEEDTVHISEVPDLGESGPGMITMNAVKDEQSGEMVAADMLEEIVVVAKFRHVAERNGEVDLVFELLVPLELQQKSWQVRFSPHYYLLGDTLATDKIHITGKRFRRIQNWEHFMYDNFVRKIVPQEIADSVYTRKRMLERFETRNGKGCAVSAKRHYRKRLQQMMNLNMASAQREIYRRFVVDPFPEGGVRLDSVVYDKSINGIRYFYAQNIKTRPGLKRVDMVMEGELYTNGRKLCNLAATSPITFYISSISSFADNSERYLKKVVYRDMHLQTSYNIEFGKGKCELDPNLSFNGRELQSIRRHIVQILDNEDYVMDSIIVASSCSPDGKIDLNDRISGLRGESVREYVYRYVEFCKDSIRRSVWNINEQEGNMYQEGIGEEKFDIGNIKVASFSEDWDTLFSYVEKDTLIADKEDIMALAEIEDPDAREAALRRMAGFGYVEENIYPKLRRVKFDFRLHRKGMIKDTVHTTELDTVYMRGVEALMERDYKLAVTLLRPYGCYNAAVAYVCMGYDKSALEILERLPSDARRDYMLAVVCCRLGDERKAVKYLKDSFAKDEGMRLRGNLDPEISGLMKQYRDFLTN